MTTIEKEFFERRKRGISILLFNLVLTIVLLFLEVYFHSWSKLFYVMIIYLIFSILLFARRLLKNKPFKDDSNYIFGENIGNKMNKVPQKFIYEASIMSLSLLVITGILSTIFSVIYLNISIYWKIVIVVSGFFGAIFMSMILITTFQQYKLYMNVLHTETETVKGGEISKWLEK